MRLYHLTPAANLASIRRHGLVPRIGTRSRNAGESQARIWAFRSLDDAEEAVVNWLGDTFYDDDKIALIAIEADEADVDPAVSAPYETALRTAVPAVHLTVLDEDVLASPEPLSRFTPRAPGIDI